MPKPDDCLNQIAAIIESVDDRCMAADGPVSRTADEMTDTEWQTIYRLATGRKLTKKHKAIIAAKAPKVDVDLSQAELPGHIVDELRDDTLLSGLQMSFTTDRWREATEEHEKILKKLCVYAIRCWANTAHLGRAG